MFMIRMWVRAAEHPKPYYLVTLDDGVLRCTTAWALAGNRVQTYPTERSANLAFKQLVDRKAFLDFRQQDDSDAAIEGSNYEARDMKVVSYEIQLVDVEFNRVIFRLSGPR